MPPTNIDPPAPAPAPNTNTPDVGNCPWAIVSHVQIQSLGGSVTFTSLASNGKLATFTVQDDEVWWTPGPHCPPSVAKQVGATGNLYLHWNGWHKCDKQNGGISGFDPAGLHTQGNVVFKYPTCLFAEPLRRLAITPSTITVVTDRGEHLDLSSADFAPAQRLVWNALSNLNIKLASGDELDVWPMQILVTGTPAQGSTRTIDVLDRQYTALLQTLEWKRFGDPVELKLRPSGFFFFNAPF